MTDYHYNREDSAVNNADEVAKHISDFLNCMVDKPRIDALVERMACQHRTLQQTFMKFVVQWITHNAHTNFYDGRNEASVNLCKELWKTIADSKMGGYLPTV